MRNSVFDACHLRSRFHTNVMKVDLPVHTVLLGAGLRNVPRVPCFIQPSRFYIHTKCGCTMEVETSGAPVFGADKAEPQLCPSPGPSHSSSAPTTPTPQSPSKSSGVEVEVEVEVEVASPSKVTRDPNAGITSFEFSPPKNVSASPKEQAGSTEKKRYLRGFREDIDYSCHSYLHGTLPLWGHTKKPESQQQTS